MKRIILNLILISVYTLLAAAVILIFAADTWFNAAKKLDGSYRWKKAESAFRTAIKLDPYNAVYLAGYGQFLFKQSLYYKDKIALLDEAATLYSRALNLNPRCAEYYLRLGEIDIDRYLLKGATDLSFPRKPALPAGRRDDPRLSFPRKPALPAGRRDDPRLSFPRKRESILKSGDSLKSIDEAMADFRRAIEADPNGFGIAYEVGYSGLKVWDHLGDLDKEMVLNRLRYALELNFKWYAPYIYPAAWKYTRDFNILKGITPDNSNAYEGLYSFIKQNNLWQFRKEIMALLEIPKKREKPDEFAKETDDKMRLLRSLRSLAMTSGQTDWSGKSDSGKNEYKNGAMYWTGSIHKAINVPEGKSTLTIKAKGQEAYDIWPYMVVELDDEAIGETFISNVEWSEYEFDIDTTGGTKVLSITYMNDGGNLEKGIDRNLYIGEARVDER